MSTLRTLVSVGLVLDDTISCIVRIAAVLRLRSDLWAKHLEGLLPDNSTSHPLLPLCSDASALFGGLQLWNICSWAVLHEQLYLNLNILQVCTRCD